MRLYNKIMRPKAYSEALVRLCQVAALLFAVMGVSRAQQKEQPVQLSEFEVATTQDTVYVVNNTATGFKTNQSLMKIPQSVTVLTRDLIDDVGAIPSDLLH